MTASKGSGILGVDHVAIFTPRLEDAEAHYADLFQARVMFRGATHKGEWVSVDGAEAWGDIRRRGVHIAACFLRAGALTISVIDEPPPGKGGPLNHVGIGCSDAEFHRIKERVRALGLRKLEDAPQGFKFVDPLGVIWEVSRGVEVTRPAKRLDLGSGRVE